jgi:hypothetical protein
MIIIYSWRDDPVINWRDLHVIFGGWFPIG